MAEAHKIAEDHQVAGQGEEGVAFDAVKQRDPRHRDLCSIARAEVVDVPCIFFVLLVKIEVWAGWGTTIYHHLISCACC